MKLSTGGRVGQRTCMSSALRTSAALLGSCASAAVSWKPPDSVHHGNRRAMRACHEKGVANHLELVKMAVAS